MRRRCRLCDQGTRWWRACRCPARRTPPRRRGSAWSSAPPAATSSSLTSAGMSCAAVAHHLVLLLLMTGNLPDRARAAWLMQRAPASRLVIHQQRGSWTAAGLVQHIIAMDTMCCCSSIHTCIVRTQSGGRPAGAAPGVVAEVPDAVRAGVPRRQRLRALLSRGPHRHGVLLGGRPGQHD